MSYTLRKINNAYVSDGRDATIILDGDFINGKLQSQGSLNLGMFAGQGYQCQARRRTNGPRPADVVRLAQAKDRDRPRMRKVNSMPQLQPELPPVASPQAQDTRRKQRKVNTMTKLAMNTEVMPT
eukprot:TRINITY_DN37141_c0_g1_i1.p1 TRINITY_DN37141_c0_g1~~TRINITY_DN37141_c0_g1_i1.p1  ORF type:complete len:125 (-),score=22.55 TRINITY_DN37141_c0_g1_i1:44-418(-)